MMAASLLWLSCPVLAAGAGQLPYHGTWSGTIGGSKIQVCFADVFDSQYYYLKHKMGIKLTQEEGGQNPNEWREAVVDKNLNKELTGIWKIATVTPNSIEGSWINPGTQQSRDIKLQRVSNSKDQCDEAFYAPLMQSKYRYGTAKLQKKTFKTIKTDNGTAFQVPSDVKNADKINAFVQSWIKEQSVAGFDCNLNGGEPWDKTLEPILWTERWLVMEDSLPDTFCGGAHGDSLREFHVFDLNSGDKVNAWSWLIDGENSVASGQEEGKKTKLRQLLELNPEDDCKEMQNDFTLREPYPTRKELVFSTRYRHADRACEGDIAIEFNTMQPFLTPAGKEAVKSIMQGE